MPIVREGMKRKVPLAQILSEPVGGLRILGSPNILAVAGIVLCQCDRSLLGSLMGTSVLHACSCTCDEGWVTEKEGGELMAQPCSATAEDTPPPVVTGNSKGDFLIQWWHSKLVICSVGSVYFTRPRTMTRVEMRRTK